MEVLSVLVNTSNRNQLYISVRSSSDGGDPYVARVYRYDFAKQKLARIFRQGSGAGFFLTGFVGSKLIVVGAPYGDNSPGPCWLDSAMTDKKLNYLNINSPWLGIKTFTPTKAFTTAHSKAETACLANLTVNQ